MNEPKYTHEELWGPLAPRYCADDPRPRKILALDGGGIRGVLSLEIVAKLERVLAARSADPAQYRLSDDFDYIGGTSTGAIIAAGLAIGMSTADLLSFYTEFGKQMFEKSSLIRRLKSFYRSEPLTAKLQEIFKERTLDPKHLKCLLLVVTRNATTDSPWPLSSNPSARYNLRHLDSKREKPRKNCNLDVPLWQLVRASTAAPAYFPPEVVDLDKDDPDQSFVFVDGGVTPYNNPAFLMYRMATLPQYRLNWRTGEEQLMIVSVGTGSAPKQQTRLESPDVNIGLDLYETAMALMYASCVDQDINCRMVGRCVHGAPIDRELGDLIPSADVPDHGRKFRYVRYDVDLSFDGLQKLGVSEIKPELVQQLDAVKTIRDLRLIGKAAAERLDVEAHLGPFLTRPER